MIAFLRSQATALAIGGTLALAAVSGAFAAVAFTGSSTQTPTRTVTLSVENGATGPQGPTGPPGPKGDPGTGGAENCPTGSTFSKLIINTPGGHATLLTCLED